MVSNKNFLHSPPSLVVSPQSSSSSFFADPTATTSSTSSSMTEGAPGGGGTATRTLSDRPFSNPLLSALTASSPSIPTTAMPPPAGSSAVSCQGTSCQSPTSSGLLLAQPLCVFGRPENERKCNGQRFKVERKCASAADAKTTVTPRAAVVRASLLAAALCGVALSAHNQKIDSREQLLNTSEICSTGGVSKVATQQAASTTQMCRQGAVLSSMYHYSFKNTASSKKIEIKFQSFS